MRKWIVLTLIAAAGAATTVPVDAKSRSVRCWVTGVGAYPCTFTPLAGDGSFKISARNRDSYTLTLNGDGTAYAFLQVRGQGRTIALPGIYVRDAADRACWANSDPAFRICAR
jgi:hypothetical protein